MGGSLPRICILTPRMKQCSTITTTELPWVEFNAGLESLPLRSTTPQNSPGLRQKQMLGLEGLTAADLGRAPPPCFARSGRGEGGKAQESFFVSVVLHRSASNWRPHGPARQFGSD